MNTMQYGRIARAIVAAGAFALALPLGAAQRATENLRDENFDADHPRRSRHLCQEFRAAVEKDSGGRIKAEVYPASQLGSIPRQIEGTQFGAIQCEVVPPEFMVGLDSASRVLAAPGLVDSLAQGQRVAADPAVLKLMLSLGADKGLHGVGLFMAEPSESSPEIRSAISPISRARRSGFSPRNSKAWRSNGSA